MGRFIWIATGLSLSACAADTGDWWGDEDEDVSGSSGMLVTSDPGDTDEAEVAHFLPVGRSRDGAPRRVVLRLSPSELPSLRTGDRLITPAEVELTTRCDVGQSAPGCGYNPNIAGQLILTGSRGDTSAHGAGSQALSDVQTMTCTKAEHHCRMVFTPRQANNVVRGALELPCVRNDSCFVNLVMWAWHHDARSSRRDRVIVGENEEDFLQHEAAGHAEAGRDGGKARLMVIRERGVRPSERDRDRTSGSGTVHVPTNASDTLIYSHRLGDLHAGEQYVIEAKVVADVSSRARFSTLMFLTHDRHGTHKGNVADHVFPSAISEHNGVNCTGSSPCVTRRVAVFRVNDDVSGPVYVNLIARSAVPGGGGARVTVRRGDGWIRSTRYDPDAGRGRATRSVPVPDAGGGTGGGCGPDVASCIDDIGLERCDGDIGILSCGPGDETQRCTCTPEGFVDCGPCG